MLARVAALAGGLDRDTSPALVARAIRDVASDVLRSGLAGGLNFLLSDGDRLWAHRHGYTLYWLDRRRPEAGRPYLRFMSRDIASILESKALLGERALLVASERLTDEPWQAVPNDGVLCFDQDLAMLASWA